MLNRLDGVSKSSSLPKQRGEVKKIVVGGSDENETTNPPKSKDPKVNVSSRSKGK